MAIKCLGTLHFHGISSAARKHVLQVCLVFCEKLRPFFSLNFNRSAALFFDVPFLFVYTRGCSGKINPSLHLLFSFVLLPAVPVSPFLRCFPQPLCSFSLLLSLATSSTLFSLSSPSFLYPFTLLFCSTFPPSVFPSIILHPLAPPFLSFSRTLFLHYSFSCPFISS